MDKEIEKYIEEYLPSFESLFQMGFCRIHFHHNPKYPEIEGKDVYYIGFDDIFAYKFVIRAGVFEKYNDSSDPIVASYNSAREVLEDGWRLD